MGAAGQKRLKAAKVLCVGAGGLGSPACLYLAAAGVGTLGLVDFDTVDASNLQRQILYAASDVGRPKVDAAQERLKAFNPHIDVRVHQGPLSAANALALFSQYDVVVDGTDNFATRYLINDACVLLGKPNVHASVFRFEGQLSVFGAKDGPCYRCLYPQAPPPGLVPACGEAGVLGVLPGVMGTLQATETLKLILRLGEPLSGRLLLFDALDMRFSELKVRRDDGCAVCGKNPSVRALVDYEAFCGVGFARGEAVPSLTALELLSMRQRGEPHQLVDVRERGEREVNVLENSLSIPLGALSTRYTELSMQTPIVVYCNVGQRSAEAVRLLATLGFTRVYNLEGGIAAWLDEVDEDQPRY